jgi:hypothetical protein
MNYLRFFLYLSAFLVLTTISQIGGIIVGLHLLTYKILSRKIRNHNLHRTLFASTFLLFYLGCVIWIIPVLANSFGRESLPWKSEYIQASNISTILLFRNYATSGSTEILNTITKQARSTSHNQTLKLVYLDACFPFIDGFPLVPHLSHSDGKKIDLGFLYYAEGAYQVGKLPNIIGYGMYEEPIDGEFDQPEICLNEGYWQYSALALFTGRRRANMCTDNNLNHHLGSAICQHPKITRVFLEPHLVRRWNINSPKLRYHGCHAVRHDDHFHIEIK